MITMTRERHSLLWFGIAAAVAAVGTALVVWPGSEQAETAVSVPTAVVESDGVVYLEEPGVFVVSLDDGEFVALADDSKHIEGERVIVCELGEYFLEWQHGSKWDLAGRYLAGPAPADLDRYSIETVGPDLVVDLSDRQVFDARTSSDLPALSVRCPETVDRPGFAPEPLGPPGS